MSKKNIINVPSIVGRQYGKIDLERTGNAYFNKIANACITTDFWDVHKWSFLGFFIYPEWGPFDQYQGPVQFREGIEKGRQILSGPSKKLFEKKFERVFEGESLTEPWREEAKQRVCKNVLHEINLIIHWASEKTERKGKSAFVYRICYIDWNNCYIDLNFN